MKKSRLAVIILLASLVCFSGLKMVLDGIPRSKIPGSSIIYIPSGQYLKYATFGFSSLAADLIYLWAIQYYSNTEIENRFDYLDHIFSIISELDPHYLDPYEVGAVIAVYEARNLDLAFKILDRGLENNPDEWLFPYEAGHYAQRYKMDFERAREYYRRAMEIEGAPSQTRRLYANALFETMDYRAAWESWLDIYRNAPDERTKQIASNHLYQVKAAMDIQAISAALEEYRSRFGHLPSDLEQLVQTGLLASLPRDMDDKDYIYDPDRGEVRPPSIPWKRSS